MRRLWGVPETPSMEMRKRDKIESDPKVYEALLLEVLLDIRELLIKQKPKRTKKREVSNV